MPDQDPSAEVKNPQLEAVMTILKDLDLNLLKTERVDKCKSLPEVAQHLQELSGSLYVALRRCHDSMPRTGAPNEILERLTYILSAVGAEAGKAAEKIMEFSGEKVIGEVEG